MKTQTDAIGALIEAGRAMATLAEDRRRGGDDAEVDRVLIRWAVAAVDAGREIGRGNEHDDEAPLVTAWHDPTGALEIGYDAVDELIEDIGDEVQFWGRDRVPMRIEQNASISAARVADLAADWIATWLPDHARDDDDIQHLDIGRGTIADREADADVELDGDDIAAVARALLPWARRVRPHVLQTRIDVLDLTPDDWREAGIIVDETGRVLGVDEERAP